MTADDRNKQRPVVDWATVRDGTSDKPAETQDEAPEAEPRKRPDPTRYGDWEKDGRCVDF